MFDFKQFTIRQDRCAMKVGTDSVLLGAWAFVVDDCKRILDIGSGTGVVALMLAQRVKSVQIVGVEIDKQAADQAFENVSASKWGDRISIFNGAIQDFYHEEKFDLIVSNPPFFTSSLKCQNQERTMARHSDTLSLRDLVNSAKRLLKSGGRFVVILPVEESRRLDIEMSGKLFLWRRCTVITKRGEAPKRMLSEYRFEMTQMVEDEELVINCEDGYSAEYIELTRDFYTQF